jgi:hypothetical protein
LIQIWKRESRLGRGGFGFNDECVILSRRCEPAAVRAREWRDRDRAQLRHGGGKLSRRAGKRKPYRRERHPSDREAIFRVFLAHTHGFG